MRQQLTERIAHEVEDLHAFFVAWFTGTCPMDEGRLTSQFRDRFAEGCTLIQPGGVRIGIPLLTDALRSAYGKSDDFRIAIRNVRLERVDGNVALATYEEWQRNARNSTPPDNGRLSTVLFGVEPERLRWLHIHETWLPEDVMAAGPYDF